MNAMVMKGTPREISAGMDTMLREAHAPPTSKRTPEERGSALLAAFARERMIRAYGKAELARAAAIVGGQCGRVRCSV